MVDALEVPELLRLNGSPVKVVEGFYHNLRRWLFLFRDLSIIGAAIGSAATQLDIAVRIILSVRVLVRRTNLYMHPRRSKLIAPATAVDDKPNGIAPANPTALDAGILQRNK